jgi:uncharacterized repeat protein (TIGR01451 family)
MQPRGWLVAPLLAVAASWLDAGDHIVNSTPNTVASGPTIAKGPGGDFVTAWACSGCGSMIGLRARRFGANGLPLADDFAVNDPYFSDGSSGESVARFPDGGHVVAWSTIVNEFPLGDPILPSFYACRVNYRLYAADGSPAGAQQQIGYDGAPLFCGSGHPAAATQPDGSGVVVFQQGLSSLPFQAEIHAVRFPSAGNLPTTLSSTIGSTPDVSASPTGELAVTWWGPGSGGVSDLILLRLFGPDGTPQGLEFAVNEMGASSLGLSPEPSLAFGSQGTILVVWTSRFSPGSDNGTPSVQARRVAADGTLLGPQFQVNTLVAGEQSRAEAAALPDGSFLVTWQSQASYQGDASGFSIQSRRVLADGSMPAPEQQVNALEAGDQTNPSLATDASGVPTYVWVSQGADIRASDDRTDLGITVTDNATTTLPGGTLQYLITVTNVGPADVPGAHVTNAFPTEATCTWTCSVSGGASCSGGSHPGNVVDTASVPVGGIVLYTGSCLVDGDAFGTLLDTAAVTASPGLTDTNAANDTASDTTEIAGLKVFDVAIAENAPGPGVPVVVELNPAPVAPVTVDYATADGTATVADGDYLPASGTLTFLPGQTLQSIPLGVLDDNVFEADETFLLTLTNPSGSTIVDGVGEVTTLNDDSAQPSGSVDELVHGSSETRSLESAPGPVAIAQYWRIRQEAGASYEVGVDATSGDLGPEGPALERVASDGTILQRANGEGAARSLRWASSVGPVTDERIRVQSRGCILDCDAADVFRVRMWETTASMARFNNSATQVTVVLLQNPTPEVVTGSIGFFGQDGTLLWQEPLSLAPGATLALNSSGIPALQGQGGSIRVASDAPYGALQGKAVAVEPATGFTFDTPLVPRPR